MKSIRIVAAGAAASVIAGAAFMTTPAHAVETAPAPTTPSLGTAAQPSSLPLKIDRDCLKTNLQERHQLERQLAKQIYTTGLTKTKPAALAAAKKIVADIIKNPAILTDSTQLSKEVLDVLKDFVSEIGKGTADDPAVRDLVAQIRENIVASTKCFGFDGKLPAPGGDHNSLPSAGWVSSYQLN